MIPTKIYTNPSHQLYPPFAVVSKSLTDLDSQSKKAAARFLRLIMSGPGTHPTKTHHRGFGWSKQKVALEKED